MTEIRRIKCTIADPVDQSKVRALKEQGFRVVISHEDVAYSEKRNGMYCLNCGWGPLGKPRGTRV